MTTPGTAPVESAESLPTDVGRALRRHVLSLADSKRLLGIRYSDWTLGAPSIETDIATSSMAQDEWGHARLLYAMLKDFGDDPVEVEHEREASAYANLDGLDGPFRDWAEVVAGMTVLDGALTSALESFAAGGYEPARSRVPKMVGEEAFHRDLAHAWVRRLAGGTGEARERLADAMRRFLPRTLAWLTPDDAAHRALVDAGLVEDAELVLRRFGDRTADALGRIGIAVGEPGPEREGWDEARGRGPGQPADDAVERARGDLNRALFVE